MVEIIGILVTALVGVGVYLLKSREMEQATNGSREQIARVLRSFPNWDSHEELYMQWLEMHHARVFDEHFRIVGRRCRMEFDAEGYWNGMFSSMAEQAESGGHTDCAEFLEGALVSFQSIT